MSGLIVSELTVNVGGRDLVSRTSFTAEAGAVTGLVGPNGAGKSTLLSALLGLRPIAGGAVYFEGTDLLGMPRRERARIAAFVEQSASTEERLSVTDVVRLGRIPYQTLWQDPSARAADDDAVSRALELAGLTALAERLYATLSGGERQRVHLARALAQDPRLLVLDEPTSHLDIHAQIEALELLRRTAGRGATILIALHDLNLAMRYCDRLVMLKAGHVMRQGTPEEVLTPSSLKDVYGVAARRLDDPQTGRAVIIYDGVAHG